MAVKYTNNARTTLASGIDTGDTTFSIASADAGKFPTLGAGDWFPLTIIDNAGNMEIVRVTARSGAALTVTRAQEGTTAKAFASGTRCDLRPTAALLNEIYNNSYSKTESYSKAQIDSGFYGKDAIDTKLAAMETEISGKQANLGYSPVNKAGDTMSGSLEIRLNNPTFWLHFPDVKRGRWTVDPFGSLLWQDQGGQTHFYINNVGAVWTQQLGDLNSRIEGRAAAYADDRKNACVTASRMSGYIQAQPPFSGGGNWENSGYVITLINRLSGDQYLFGARQPQLFIANVGWFAAFPFS